MKKSLSNLVIGVLIILMLSTVSIGHTPEITDCKIHTTRNPIPAGIVWSENFDDGNLSDWGIYAIAGVFPYDNPPGNFTTEDGTLRVNGSDGTGMSIANTSSSVAYGTWIFDVDVVDTYDDEIVIPFLMLNWTLTHWGIDCYFLLIVTGEYSGIYQPRLKPGKTYATNTPRGRAVQWFEEYEYDDILGWKHFVITREDDGQFYIYMNGTLACGFKDNQHQTCKEFVFASGPGPAIDNIEVYDEVIYDAAPPELEPQIPRYLEITEGESFYYDANATDFSGIDNWWIDDTENFTINQNGVITSNYDLAAGEYPATVSVNDTNGFTTTGKFSLIVYPASEPTTTDTTLTTTATTTGETPPIPFELIVATGGIVVVVLIVIIWRSRK